jgi:hypothetical protein
MNDYFKFIDSAPTCMNDFKYSHHNIYKTEFSSNMYSTIIIKPIKIFGWLRNSISERLICWMYWLNMDTTTWLLQSSTKKQTC